MSARELTPLDFDPFEGDFGDQGDRSLADKMVIGRKAYTCNHCGQPIAVGERHRHKRGVYDGDFMQWRWCALCCDAMVQAMSPPDEEDDPTGEIYDAATMAFELRGNLREDATHGE